MIQKISALFVALALLLMVSPANAQVSFSAILQNRRTSNSNGTILNTTNMSTAVLTVNCDSCSATQVNFEGTQDGTNYTSLLASLLGTTTTATSTTTAGVTVWSLGVSGLRNVRARVSAYSVGTVTVTGLTSMAGSGGGSGGGGGGSNACASATGSAVPSSGCYNSINVAGTLRGQTGVNPSGSIYTADVSIRDSAGAAISAVSDPCDGSAKSKYPVNIATASTAVVQTASVSNKFYLCSIFLFSGSADNVAFVEDATGSCASPDAGIYGGTTTGTGVVLTAGQGFVLGDGKATVGGSASTNVNVCLITSANVQLTGVITYVLAP